MNTQELSDLLWLVAVIDQQSFSKAAQKLGVSKSVVSKHISRLEEILGVQLLKRSTRKLALTEAGTLIYERVAQIAEDLQEVKQLAYSHHDTPQGKLRINAPFSFGQKQLIPLVAEFMQQYPSIRIELLLGSYLADLITEGVDLAIYLKEPPNDLLVARKIGGYHKQVCATPAYFKHHGIPKHPLDLLEHNCLVYKNLERSKPWWFLENGKEIEIKVQGSFCANSSQALLNAALAHIGLVQLPSHMLSESLAKGSLLSVLDDYCLQDLGIYIARAQTSFVPKKVRLFIDFLLEQV